MQILSVDCLMMNFAGSEERYTGTQLRPINLSTVLYTLLPFGIFASSYVFWRIFGFFKRISRNDIYDRTLATQVIVLFLFYPTIVGILADSVNCISIEGESRLYKDLEQVCLKGQHAIVFYCATVPGMIFWAGGIPLFALYNLQKNRKQLETLRERLGDVEGGAIDDLASRFNIRLGFLTAGFSEEHYYWEIVLLMRKTIIVMMVTFLAPVSAGIQSLFALFVLLGFFWLQMKVKPYYAEQLNVMEKISLIVMLLTIYSGLYYLSGKEDPIMQSGFIMWVVFLMVLCPSLIFTGYFV